MAYIKNILLLALVVGACSEPLQLGNAYLASDDSQSGPLSGSVMGGTEIIIQATGLTGMAGDYAVSVGDYFCAIAADGVQSNRISCLTSPTGGNSDVKDLPITVYYNMGSYEVTGKDFDYLVGQTPIISYVFPQAASPLSLLHYFGTHRIVDSGDGLRSWGDIKSVHIGDSLCNLENVDQVFAGNANSFDEIRCRQSKTLEGGKYTTKTKVLVGDSQSDPSIVPTNFEGEYYEHVVVPTIETVSPNTGLLAGQ